MISQHSESSLVEAIRKYAEEIGARFYKNPPTVSGRPDISVIKNNRIAIIETKKQGVNKVRVSQLIEIKKLRDCGNIVLVSNNFREVKEFIDATLQISKRGHPFLEEES